jgi:hypothetical protein
MQAWLVANSAAAGRAYESSTLPISSEAGTTAAAMSFRVARS